MTKKEAAYGWQLLKMLRARLHTNVDFPAIIELQTINRCSASCPMCPYPDTIGKQPLYHMSDGLFERILEQLTQEPNFQILVLSFQNEPLMDKNLLARAKRFKALLPGKNLQMVTNGCLLRAEDIQQVYEYFDLVSISINALTEDTYKLVMPGLLWEKTQANLNLIASQREWVNKTILRFIRQRENKDESVSFKRHWNAKGFRVFGFEVNNRVGSVKGYDNLKIQKSIAGQMRMRALSLIGKLLIPSCPIPFLSFYIRANGDVVLCFNDYCDDNVYGNVCRDSIRDVFGAPKYSEARENALKKTFPNTGLCKKCDLYYEGIWLTV